MDSDVTSDKPFLRNPDIKQTNKPTDADENITYLAKHKKCTDVKYERDSDIRQNVTVSSAAHMPLFYGIL